MQVLIDRQAASVVVAHGEAHRVTARDVTVHPAAVDLVLLVVEPVHQVPRAATGQALTLGHPVGKELAGLRATGVRGLDEGVDQERPVGEGRTDRSRADGAAAVDRQRRRGQVDVVLRQARQRRTGGVDLRLRVRSPQPVDAFPAAEQVVEAVVLLVDHHDVLDRVEPRIVVVGAGHGRREQRTQAEHGGRAERDRPAP